jgi:hypothetical protein
MCEPSSAYHPSIALHYLKKRLANGKHAWRSLGLGRHAEDNPRPILTSCDILETRAKKNIVAKKVRDHRTVLPQNLASIATVGKLKSVRATYSPDQRWSG